MVKQRIRRGRKIIQWRRFDKARDWAHSLGLTSWAEWRAFKRGEFARTLGTIPHDIPRTPDKVYESDGWVDYPDFMGYRSHKNFSCSYEQARKFARSLKLNSAKHWRQYFKGQLDNDLPPFPNDMPKNPHIVYRDKGWINWQDFLGYKDTRRRVKNKRPFEEALQFVRSLKLSSLKEWLAFCHGELEKTHGLLPDDLPITPNLSYKGQGWQGLHHWLGIEVTHDIQRKNRKRATGAVKIVFLPFNEAREFARSLKLKTSGEWQRYCSGEFMNTLGTLPENVPKTPRIVYKDNGWCGMSDWLGKPAEGRWREIWNFHKAQEFARSLELSSSDEWRDYCKGMMPDKPAKPDGVPSSPDVVRSYKKYWKGYRDWLGNTGKKVRRRNFRSYEDARAFVHTLGLMSNTQWKAFVRNELVDKLGECPADIPRHPNDVYKDDGWNGWQDWLGYKEKGRKRKTFLPFDEARAFVHNLKLSNLKEWQAYARAERPGNIPSDPGRTYKNDWKGFSDWLGN